MMKNSRQQFRMLISLVVLSLLRVAAPAGATETSEDTAFDEIIHHYEAVRLTLVSDSAEGIAEHAEAIRGIVQRLETDWSAARAGVHADQASEARSLLPELGAAAAQLTEADTLEAARDAFYALSKPLVRLRKTAIGDQSVVAYCSMAKRSWLQPEGELGNPYYGPSMPLCGEVVGE